MLMKKKKKIRTIKYEKDFSFEKILFRQIQFVAIQCILDMNFYMQGYTRNTHCYKNMAHSRNHVKQYLNFIAIALDETSKLVTVHFSIRNIYQSCDLSTSASKVFCLLSFAWR